MGVSWCPVELDEVGALSLRHSCTEIADSFQTQSEFILEPKELYFSIVEALVCESRRLFCSDSESGGVPYILQSCHVAD